jgi:hypothetical protein
LPVRPLREVQRRQPRQAARWLPVWLAGRWRWLAAGWWRWLAAGWWRGLAAGLRGVRSLAAGLRGLVAGLSGLSVGVRRGLVAGALTARWLLGEVQRRQLRLLSGLLP